jgi:hypothetical protein
MPTQYLRRLPVSHQGIHLALYSLYGLSSVVGGSRLEETSERVCRLQFPVHRIEAGKPHSSRLESHRGQMRDKPERNPKKEKNYVSQIHISISPGIHYLDSILGIDGEDHLFYCKADKYHM